MNDLGVTIDEHLSFSKHINNIARKAHARCSLIMKCFQSKRLDCLVKAYVTYVRPLLEYNSPVWSPHWAKDIRTLERVQKRFSKKLPALHDLSYSERLERLGLERLEARRIRADLVLTYKIVSGLSELTLSDFFTLSNVTQTRGHMYKLCMPKFRTDVRKYCFCFFFVAIWNDLPADKINFNSLASFTRTLSLLSFDQYCLDSY